MDAKLRPHAGQPPDFLAALLQPSQQSDPSTKAALQVGARGTLSMLERRWPAAPQLPGATMPARLPASLLAAIPAS